MKCLTTHCVREEDIYIFRHTRMSYQCVSLPNNICNCNKKFENLLGKGLMTFSMVIFEKMVLEARRCCGYCGYS